jgi:hypothetical protein
VGEQLGLVLGSPDCFDPFGRSAVLVGPLRAWDLPIRNVANEDVVERILRLAFNRAASLATDELLADECVETLFE